MSSSGGGLPGRPGFERIRTPLLFFRSLCGADTLVREKRAANNFPGTEEARTIQKATATAADKIVRTT
jgi:hypothetical protein